MAFYPKLDEFEQDWYNNKLTNEQKTEFEKFTRTEEENKLYLGMDASKKEAYPENDEKLYTKRKQYIYKLTSQYLYQFIALDSNEQKITEASFCRILQKNNDYYILTCYHNIKADAKNYMLKNENVSIDINLHQDTEKIKNLDAAILKIRGNQEQKLNLLKNYEFKPKLSSSNAKSAIGFEQLNLNSQELEEGASGGCVFDENLLCGVYLTKSKYANIKTILFILNNGNESGKYELA